jgi:hypothetical protein
MSIPTYLVYSSSVAYTRSRSCSTRAAWVRPFASGLYRTMVLKSIVLLGTETYLGSTVPIVQIPRVPIAKLGTDKYLGNIAQIRKRIVLQTPGEPISQTST